VQTLTNEYTWLILFVLSYSITSINTGRSAILLYINDIIFSFSGLLFTVFLFKLSILTPYVEYQWLVGFLMALTFKDILPSLMEFVVDVTEAKLQVIKEKIIGDKA
jgi:hypothetical protein